MNSLNSFCQMASLTCCLILGIEGFLFGHNIVTNVRLIEPPQTVVEKQRPVVNQETARSRARKSVVPGADRLTAAATRAPGSAASVEMENAD